jgi:WD40 repeat protein
VVRIWDARTGEEVAVLRGHEGSVRTVTFSPDGLLLASGGGDTTVRLWAVGTWKPIHTFKGHLLGVSSLSFTPDGSTLASAAFPANSRAVGEVKLWNVDTGRLRLNLGADARTVVAFSPDGKILATGGADGAVRLWDPETGKERDALVGHRGPVRSLAWTADGRTLVSSGSDDAIYLWDVKSGNKRPRSRLEQAGLRGVAVSPDGRRIATVGVGGLKLWDTETGKEQNVTGYSATVGVSSIAFDVKGQTLGIGRDRGDVHLWDVDKAEERFSQRGHFGAVFELAFSADGLTLASIGRDNTVRLWDVLAGQQLASWEWGWGGSVPEFSALAFSPDGEQLAVGTDDNSLRLQRLARKGGTDSLEEFSDLKGHSLPARQARFTADGRTLCSAAWNPNGKEIEVARWDLARHALSERLLHLPISRTAALAPEGKRVAVGIHGGARVWDLDNGNELPRLGGQSHPVFCLDFTRDGKRLASGSHQSVVVWDVEKQTILGRHAAHRPGWIRSVALSPDGKLVVSAGDDQRVIVWDVARNKKVGDWTLPWRDSRIVFAPDGRHLALGNANGTIFLLRLPRR